jgi:hypothetical protein
MKTFDFLYLKLLCDAWCFVLGGMSCAQNWGKFAWILVGCS